MSIAVTSPDISVLDFKVLFDMSLATPRVTLTNLSTVINATNLQWSFVFVSALGTPIHIGDTSFTAPDIDGVAFTTYIFSEQLPQPFSQLEFSAVNTYQITAHVKDSDGNIFSMIISDSICKPAGNTGKGNFGAANIDIKAQCHKGKLLVTDTTILRYKSITGVKVTTNATIRYPKSEDGTQPQDFVTNQLPFLADIVNGGDGYSIYVAHIYDFESTPGFVVRVRFSYNNAKFAVWCNVDLCPLFCEYDKLLRSVEKNCDTETRAENNKKLMLINAKLLKASIGLQQPLCDFDVPALVEEIKEIGGFECDCCRPAGLPGVGAVVGSDFTLAVVKDGGDIEMEITDDGNGNFTIHYSDKTYVFQMCVDNTTTAFEIIPRYFEYSIIYCLKVNLLQLAGEILTEIQNNASLTTIINSIVQGQGASTCSINSQGLFTTSCDYVTEINSATVSNALEDIVINGVVYNAPGGLLVTQDSAIASWLNSLSKGVFTAIYSSVSKKTAISSVANINSLATISTVTTDGNETLATFAFTNSCGNICGILQSIIDYLSTLNLLQTTIGGKVNVCRINADGTVTTTEFLGGENSYLLAVALGEASCNAASYLSAKGLSPDNLKAQFSEYTNISTTPVAGDYFFMVVGGKLIKMPLEKAAYGIFSLLSSDSAVKSIYCQGSLCAIVNDCSPVTNLSVSAGDATAQAIWTQVVGAVGYKYSMDGINYYQISNTTVLIAGLDASTAYSLRVYPVYNNGDGIDCQVTLNFVTTGVGAACAAVASFVADNLMDDSARITWAGLTGASGYQYRLNGGSWINVGNVLVQTLGSLTADTLYTAEIRAIMGGVPCANISTVNFTTTLSTITFKNDLSETAIDFVLSKLSANGFNLYGGALLESGQEALITVPIIATSYLWTVTVVSDIAGVDSNVKINHKRGATILNTVTQLALGAGVATDITFAAPFVVEVGDIIQAVIAP